MPTYRLHMLDLRLQEQWRRERAARERLRASLPVSWRNDPRPEMDDVREIYVEAMLRARASTPRRRNSR
jgi:hypothetical protein